MRRGPAWLHAAGSLSLAAVLLALLLPALAGATLFEAKHGTEQARHLFYDATWFRVLLAALGVNVLAAVATRSPFRRESVPFLLTHVGLLLILGGALVTALLRIDGQVVVAEGETVRRYTVAEDVLAVREQGSDARASIDLDPETFGGFVAVDRPPTAPLAAGGLDGVEVLRYVPDLLWRDDVFEDGERPNPMLELSLASPDGAETGWVGPDRPTRFGPLEARLRSIDDPLELAALVAADVDAHTAGGGDAADAAPAAPIELIRGPDDALFVRLSWSGTSIRTEPVELGAAIETPWPGKTLTVTRLFQNARVAKTPVEPDDVRAKRTPALRLHLTAGAATEELWLSKYASRSVEVGATKVELAYGNKAVPLGFDLSLQAFRIVPYPGGRKPRSFESHVALTDPSTGATTHRVVSMNDPVSFQGLSLHQSSYRRDPDRNVTFLGVSRDPGLPLTFAGYVATVLGMISVVGSRTRAPRP